MLSLAGVIDGTYLRLLKAWVLPPGRELRGRYIALGNCLTSAAWLGIDVCPMEGIEPEKYNEMLGLNKLGFSAIVVATAG